MEDEAVSLLDTNEVSDEGQHDFAAVSLQLLLLPTLRTPNLAIAFVPVGTNSHGPSRVDEPCRSVFGKLCCWNQVQQVIYTGGLDGSQLHRSPRSLGTGCSHIQAGACHGHSQSLCCKRFLDLNIPRGLHEDLQGFLLLHELIVLDLQGDRHLCLHNRREKISRGMR